MPQFNLISFPPLLQNDFSFHTEINQTNSSIFLSFTIKGKLSSLDLDDPHPKKERKIKLWEKTCFELFIKNARDEYLEFNFSPRFEWNCFYFQKKGDPLLEFLKMPSPAVDILYSFDKFFLVAEIKKEFFPDNFITNDMSGGISSVLKMKNKEMTYWALTHKDQKPNFHHFDSFIYKF